MGHRIVITVHPGGRMESRVEGIAGASCDQASKWLDRLGTVVEHQHTDDYYAETEVEADATIGGSDDGD